MSEPILSRFDLFFVVLDRCDPEDDHRIAEHIIKLRMPVVGTPARPEVSTQELLQYIKLSKQVKPRLTENARRKIIRYYRAMRQNERSSYRKAYRVTVRQLESLIRLSEALARVHWSDEVRAEHVEEALKYYHITADFGAIKPLDQVADGVMAEYMNENNARQLIHITYGILLTAKDVQGKSLFKEDGYFWKIPTKGDAVKN